MDTIARAHDPLAVEQTTDRTPATARAYVAYMLAELGIPEQVADDVTQRALVIANELTTNVYSHVGGPMELDVTLSEDCGSVVITVTDHGAGVPELGLPSADLLAEHGYGLYLTSVLADSVFEYPTVDGKVIGAVIKLPGALEDFDTAFVIHDLDGTDSGDCAADCSGCAIELPGGAR
jgi:anti-sigma regulatory factor (Ser/Thr protein kinase)